MKNYTGRSIQQCMVSILLLICCLTLSPLNTLGIYSSITDDLPSNGLKTVTGIVKNDAGELLPGASILLKGTTTGTSADVDGRFTINANEGDVLVISFIGHVTQEVVVGASDEIEIVLQQDVTTMEELVVIGYGTVRKKDLTGSVASLQPKDFNQGIITAPDQLIQGRTPGVMVINNTGQPGVHLPFESEGIPRSGREMIPCLCWTEFPCRVLRRDPEVVAVLVPMVETHSPISILTISLVWTY